MAGDDSTSIRDAVLAMKQTNPELTSDEIATRLGCSKQRVEKTLEEYDSIGTDILDPAEWEDPNQCPFCGDKLRDGGPGFIDHIEDAEDCAVSFAQWREGIAGDVQGEWVG
ncbi:DUF7501 family protein [Halopiger thermotolerans]